MVSHHCGNRWMGLDVYLIGLQVIASGDFRYNGELGFGLHKLNYYVGMVISFFSSLKAEGQVCILKGDNVDFMA